MPIQMRPQSEIDDQMNKASDAVDGGGKWPGMSYEEGVEAALSWVCGLRDEVPMPEEE